LKNAKVEFRTKCRYRNLGQSILVVYASSSPYNSGYDHGCYHAGISDPSDRYMNQPEEGAAFHTQEFMTGYYGGFESCGDNSFGSEGKGPAERFEDSTGEHQSRFCTIFSAGAYLSFLGG